MPGLVPNQESHSLSPLLAAALRVAMALALSACAPVQSLGGMPTAVPAATETLVPASQIPPTALPVPSLAASPTPRRLGEYSRLAPEDMRFDLDELFHRIETTHPNPYARLSKAEADLERQRIWDELAQPMTVIDFFRSVAPLVVRLGDRHTRLFLPDEVFATVFEQELFLPLGIELDGQQAIITANYSGDVGVSLKSELRSIDGTALSSIRESLALLGTDTYPVSFGLWFLYGSKPEYRIEFLPTGESAPAQVKLESMTSAAILQAQGPAVPFEQVVYTRVPAQPIGVLAVNGFEGIGPLLKPAFARIQADNLQHLILDVRANRGGKYESVISLMDYLTGQPYRLCSRSLQAPFGGYGSGAPREARCEAIEPVEVPERFPGKLYLLIGPDTFSAGITFATVLQDYGLATLVGEGTSDPASYCADVVTEGTPLPKTGLRYTLSRTCYVRPSGVLNDAGVIPDVVIQTTVEDRLAGRDPVLARVLELIRADSQTP